MNSSREILDSRCWKLGNDGLSGGPRSTALKSVAATKAQLMALGDTWWRGSGSSVRIKADFAAERIHIQQGTRDSQIPITDVEWVDGALRITFQDPGKSPHQVLIRWVNETTLLAELAGQSEQVVLFR